MHKGRRNVYERAAFRARFAMHARPFCRNIYELGIEWRFFVGRLRFFLRFFYGVNRRNAVGT